MKTSFFIFYRNNLTFNITYITCRTKTKYVFTIRKTSKGNRKILIRIMKPFCLMVRIHPFCPRYFFIWIQMIIFIKIVGYSTPHLNIAPAFLATGKSFSCLKNRIDSPCPNITTRIFIHRENPNYAFIFVVRKSTVKTMFKCTCQQIADTLPPREESQGTVFIRLFSASLWVVIQHPVIEFSFSD